MEMKCKFINCTSYNFDNNGKHYEGFTVRVFDPVSKSIIKCKSESDVQLHFGEDITVKAIPNGRYLNYFVA